MGFTRSRVAAGLALMVVLLLAVTGAASCWASDGVHSGLFVVDHDPHEFDLEVVRVDGRTITLRGDDADLTRPGVFGLEWPGSYAQVGPVIESDGDEVTRELIRPEAEAPSVADHVRLDTFAYAGDPLSAHAIEFQAVAIATPLGPAPAWFVPGERETVVVFVHGRGADRGEALRALPTVTGLGFPALVITYRNDVELQTGPDARYAFGTEEWGDLEAAVRYALETGAVEVVLYGYSMGGAIVLSFLERSTLAPVVGAVILDAPALHLSAIADLGMKRQGVPGPLTSSLRSLVSLRFDVDWSDYDYRDAAEGLDVPLLLFHGSDDDVVPVAASRAFAASAPSSLVTYVEVADAGHVQAWNADRLRYERELARFLASR